MNCWLPAEKGSIMRPAAMLQVRGLKEQEFCFLECNHSDTNITCVQTRSPWAAIICQHFRSHRFVPSNINYKTNNKKHCLITWFRYISIIGAADCLICICVLFAKLGFEEIWTFSLQASLQHSDILPFVLFFNFATSTALYHSAAATSSAAMWFYEKSRNLTRLYWCETNTNWPEKLADSGAKLCSNVNKNITVTRQTLVSCFK